MYIHINIVSLIHCLRTVRQNQSNKNHQVKKYMYITYKYIFQVINTLTLTVSFKTVKNELLVLSISVKKKTWPTLMNQDAKDCNGFKISLLSLADYQLEQWAYKACSLYPQNFSLNALPHVHCV